MSSTRCCCPLPDVIPTLRSWCSPLDVVHHPFSVAFLAASINQRSCWLSERPRISSTPAVHGQGQKNQDRRQVARHASSLATLLAAQLLRPRLQCLVSAWYIDTLLADARTCALLLRLCTESDFVPATSFSLHDAARNHSERPSAWSSQTNLRHKGLQFVRASEGLKGTLETDKDSAKLDSANPAVSCNPAVPDVQQSIPPISPLPIRASTTQDAAATSKPPPTSDAAPASTPVPSMPSVRPPSPAQSDSSEEVIIFTGRQNGKASAGTARTAVRQNFDQEGPKDLHATGNRSDPRETAANGNDRPPATATMTQDHDAAVRSFASLSKEKRRGRTKPRRRDQLYDDTTDSDAFLADYMENLRANGELDDDFVTKASGRVVDLAGWQPEDLDDLDNLSTSDEILDKVVQVISKRERPSGVQYLVVWDGQSVDEARWIQHALLTMEGAGPLIAAFEEEEQHVLEYQDRTDSDSEDGGDSGKTSLREGGKNRQVDSSDDEEDELDEDDAIARRIERMSDEQIARLLAKQEELGMGSDELLLFEEPEGDSDYDEDDEMATAMALDVDTDNDAADSYIALGTSSKHSRSSKEKRRTRTLWKTDDEDNEDDELFGAAADYGDFDVMDFDRPSLISKPSKTKKELQVNVSDSEIEASLREQWAADRSKKKVRKQEREELRAQGLLGKRNQRKPDLSARYNEGMSIEDIMGELEEFLSTAWDR